jgi:hypothetical protein
MVQARAMTDEDMIALVQEYFAGVDNEDIDRVDEHILVPSLVSRGRIMAGLLATID